jgi:pimeloyl-ACP methyl ester carboxylesterase
MASQFHVNDSNSTVTLNGAFANWHPQLTPPAPDTFGGRMWDSQQKMWIPIDTSKLDKNARTCLFVHGIMSTVENAFPNGDSCVNNIATANGCTQIIGFNYRWWQPILTSGMDLSDFLQQLGLQNLLIEAHSLGGPVVLSALSQPGAKATNVRHLVTLGSPLTGTPASNKAENIISTLANLPTQAFGLRPAFQSVQDFVSQSFMPDVATNSPVLANVRAAATTNHPSMQVVPVAGSGGSLLDVTDPLVNSEIARLIASTVTPVWEKALLSQGLSATKSLLNGWMFGSQQQDGVVNDPSALAVDSGLNFNGGTAQTFPVSHTHLECDPRVISAVGKAVKTQIQIFPSFLAFYSQLGGSNPLPQSITILNNGSSVLLFTVTPTALLLPDINATALPWLDVSPNLGISISRGAGLCVSESELFGSALGRSL